eukprot:5893196-Pyramimonas_sp.AAC.1
MVDGYSQDGPWAAAPVPHEPPRPTAPGARPKWAPGTSSGSGGPNPSELEEAWKLIQSRMSVLEPSDLPAGVPPTAVKSPPATRAVPPAHSPPP